MLLAVVYQQWWPLQLSGVTPSSHDLGCIPSPCWSFQFMGLISEPISSGKQAKYTRARDAGVDEWG